MHAAPLTLLPCRVRFVQTKGLDQLFSKDVINESPINFGVFMVGYGAGVVTMCSTYVCACLRLLSGSKLLLGFVVTDPYRPLDLELLPKSVQLVCL